MASDGDRIARLCAAASSLTGHHESGATSPSTACAINGVLQTSDRADYHCYKWGEVDDDPETFTYLRDDRTGAYGWVWDELLEDHVISSGVKDVSIFFPTPCCSL